MTPSLWKRKLERANLHIPPEVRRQVENNEEGEILLFISFLAARHRADMPLCAAGIEGESLAAADIGSIGAS